MDEQEVRKRVEKRIKERNDFYIHLAVYVVANLMLWMFAAVVGWSFIWPLISTISWGTGLVAHGMGIYANSPERVAARERLIQREIERERDRLEEVYSPVKDKRKRDALYRLSDDGELIEVTDDEYDYGAKQKRED